MATKMVVNDENKDSMSPFLTRPTYLKHEIIKIQPSNGHPNTKMIDTNVMLENENALKSITISFDKISYKIGQTENMKFYHKWKNAFSCCKQTLNKQILFDVSGVFTPGMNAILGPTGCGKTTLLDILADRKSNHGVTGDVLVSGQRRSDCVNYTIGYVVQDNIICETLTVRENLMFSANIRLPRSFSNREKMNRVNQVIHNLNLQSCIDTLIGTNFVRGVSGGERKKACIGMELVLSPQILFLDEPTTGLDASTAQNVMECLYTLSQQGHTIIFSIHQPRYSIFKLFDTVLFLSAGHTIYLGPPIDVISYFASHGLLCEEHENPADFVLDVLITTNVRSTKILHETYLHSTMHSNIISLIESITNESDDLPSVNQIESRSCTNELYYLAQRAVRNAIRNPAVAATQTFIAIALALLTGLLFNNMKPTIDLGVSNRLGAIFFLTTHQILCTASALEPLIQERALFIHENSSGYYRVWTFFLAKIVCDLIPMRVIPSFIFSIITYPLTGFQRSIIRFLVFFITVFVSSVFGAAMCLFIAATIPVFIIALSVVILSFSMMMVMSGFLVNLDSIFSFFRWIQWISAMRYSSNLLTINEFRYLKFCLTNDTQICPLAGEQILIQRNISYETDWDVWQNLLALGVMALVFFVLAFIQLLRMKKIK